MIRMVRGACQQIVQESEQHDMSGTPKKTVATLSEELRQQLVKELEKQGNQQRQLWQKLTTEIYGHHLKLKSQDLVDRRLAELKTALTESAEALHPEAFQRLSLRCQELGVHEDATTLEQWLRKLESAETIQDEMIREITQKQEDDLRAREQIEQQEQQRLQDSLAALAIRLVTAERILRIEVNSDDSPVDQGQGAVYAVLERAREVLKSEVLTGSEAAVAETEAALKSYQERRRDNVARRTRAQDDMAHMETMVTGLKAHDNVQRWCGAQVDALQAILEEARQAASIGDVKTTGRLAHTLRETINAILKDAGARQLQMSERHLLLDKVKQSLEAIHYQVDDIQGLEKNDLNADIVLRAVQSNGHPIRLSIDPQKVIEIIPDKREIHTEQVDGVTVTTCKELEEDLQKMRAQLDQLGIRTPEFVWDGKPENRPSPSSEAEHIDPVKEHERRMDRRTRRKGDHP